MQRKFYRKKLRLPDYDYSQYGCYFVTICTKDRRNLFGHIIEGKMVLNPLGNIISNILLELESHYFNSEITDYVIMPNHLHFIWFNQSNSLLSDVVKTFKGRSTVAYREYIRTKNLIFHPLWQRSFYEHIIRNDKDYLRISEYIENNPIQWELDRFYS